MRVGRKNENCFLISSYIGSIFGCIGSLLPLACGLSLVAGSGDFSCGAQALGIRVSVVVACGLISCDLLILECGLSSCGTRA